MDDKQEIQNAEISEKTHPQFEHVQTLVLSGGGVKCLAFGGALCALQELNIFVQNNVKVYAGSSGGAMFAAMLIAGFTPEELFEKFEKIKIKDLQQIEIKKLFTNFGIDSGLKFIELMCEWFEEKGLKRNITMKQFYEITKKEFYITTTCLNKFKTIYIHHTSYPNMSVIQALRMSISVPFVFTSVKYRDDYYVDGGILDNFPIHLFDKNDSSVLGLSLNKFEDNDIDIKINGIPDFIMAMMSCFQFEISKIKNSDFKDRTIELDVSGFDTFDNITPAKLQQLYERGYNCVVNKFS